MELKIVVPVHIPEFVPIIKNWSTAPKYLFMDGEAPSGRNVRQHFTDLFADTDNYVHYLDNDNLVPHDVLNVIGKEIIFTKRRKIFMFSQIWWANGPKRLEAKPENCVPCKCDIAQLFVHGSFLKDMVWTDRYENDGDFIAELYRRYPNDFVFINDVDVWYNALKPNHGLYNGKVIQIA